MESVFNAKNVSDLASLYDLTAILKPPGEQRLRGGLQFNNGLLRPDGLAYSDSLDSMEQSFGVARLLLPPSRAYHSATEPSW
jgi:hypothetical protein